MRVLVVDDEYGCGVKLKTIFSQYGDCDLAPDGEIALMLFKASFIQGVPYNLISLDLGLPGMGGQEVLRSIRNIEKVMSRQDHHERVKILVISGSADKGDVLTAKHQGIDGYLIKPVSSDYVGSIMDQLGIPRL